MQPFCSQGLKMSARLDLRSDFGNVLGLSWFVVLTRVAVFAMVVERRGSDLSARELANTVWA